MPHHQPTNKKEVVQRILANYAVAGTATTYTTKHQCPRQYGCAFAPANLALCKYWGKRNNELNLPVTSSLSISLGNKGTYTYISHQLPPTAAAATIATATTTAPPAVNAAQLQRDIYVLNGIEIPAKTAFAKRLRAYLDLFRPTPDTHYYCKTISTIPVAAGLASSASGYAALVLALNQLYGWQLPMQQLSILARLGSGSACRSLWHGFVEWRRGGKCGGNGDVIISDDSGAIVDVDDIDNIDDVGDVDDGMDSYASPLLRLTSIEGSDSAAEEHHTTAANLQHSEQSVEYWPELRVGILLINAGTKALSSRDAMQQTMATSPFYRSWPQQVEADLATIKRAIAIKDFALFGTTAERNSLAMHATMQAAHPAIIYSHPATIAAMQRVWELRRAAIPVYFTQDAGPNLKLLFLAQDATTITKAFPNIEIIAPFDAAAVNEEQMILVDENDNDKAVTKKPIKKKNEALKTSRQMIVSNSASTAPQSSSLAYSMRPTPIIPNFPEINNELVNTGKITVHLTGKLHRAFSIVILRHYCSHNTTTVQMLLQQRSAHKYHSPNLLTNTCCGHPRPGEKTILAAERRLAEEMGITEIKLKEVGTFHYRAELVGSSGLIEHEIDHVFVGMLSGDVANIDNIHPNKAEVKNCFWVDIDFLRHDLHANPQKYTAWLPQVLAFIN
jgi:diphosphomevalonate decarboxylase